MSSERPPIPKMGGLPSRERPNPPYQPLTSGRRPTDEEDGVVAGKRPEDVRPGLGVDRSRDRLGTAGNGADDDHFANPIDGAEERRQHGLEHGVSVGTGRSAAGSERIARTFRRRHARDSELAPIARER